MEWAWLAWVACEHRSSHRGELKITHVWRVMSRLHRESARAVHGAGLRPASHNSRLVHASRIKD